MTSCECVCFVSHNKDETIQQANSTVMEQRNLLHFIVLDSLCNVCLSVTKPIILIYEGVLNENLKSLRNLNWINVF